MRTRPEPVFTVKDIKKFEKVSDKVSDKYQAIYSTDLIKILEPEFKLVQAQRTTSKSSSHYVDLVNDKKDYIRIYNSYDRRLALRVSLMAENYAVDLGTNRVIHRGTTAASLTETFRDNKKTILESIKIKKKMLTFLEETPISKELAVKISDQIFKRRMKKEKGFQSYTNYVDVLLTDNLDKNPSINAYINMSINKYFNGDYTITFNGKKRNGRKGTSVLRRITIESNIVSVLQTEFPEYFL